MIIDKVIKIEEFPFIPRNVGKRNEEERNEWEV